MQIDENTHIIVHAHDLSVTINHMQANCLTPDMIPEKMRTMTWRPGDTPRGHFHGIPDGTHEFDDFSRFAPFIAAWLPHYDTWQKREADHKALIAKKEAENAELEAKRKAAEARRDELGPLNNALSALGSTDHKVLQAIEKDLIARGVLPADFGQQRDTWRATAKQQKNKLGLV